MKLFTENNKWEFSLINKLKTQLSYNRALVQEKDDIIDWMLKKNQTKTNIECEICGKPPEDSRDATSIYRDDICYDCSGSRDN